MLKILTHLFTPQSTNNYKAKTLHISSLSIFMLIIIFSQIVFSFIGKSVPGVLGFASSVTVEELIALTNQERLENGLSELTINPKLNQAATLKAADMIQENYWAHTSPEGKTPWSFFKNVDYQYLYAGENLARDFLDSEAVVNAWMDSPTHRDNILSSRYQEIGLVVIQDTFQGQETTLVVQLFGTQTGRKLTHTGKIDQVAEVVLAELDVDHKAAGFKFPFPFLDSFNLTKAMSVSLTIILLAVIVIDSIFISRKKIIRLSGKGLAHLVFLGLLLFLLLGIQPGLIL